MRKFRFSSKGFTLIEILVVIAIIGILMAAGAVAFTFARRSARDSRRLSDMRAIQQAFEQYYAQNDDTYATTYTDMTTGFFAGGQPPRDPQANSNYTFTMTGISGNTASGYCVCADVEDNNKGNSTTNACTFATTGTLDFFCVTNRQ